MARLIFLIVFILLITQPAYSDDEDFQAWFAFATNGLINEDGRLLYWFDGHARFGDDASELGVSIFRPAIGWRVNKSLDLWLGYARVTNSIGPSDIEEDRIWQQATYSIASNSLGSFSGRTRLEQRFRDERNGDDTGHRIRQFFRWGKPIHDTDLAYVIWDEVFIGLNETDWGQIDGFDQNRAFFGLSYKVSKQARVEVGYLHNLINRENRDDLTNTLYHQLCSGLFNTRSSVHVQKIESKAILLYCLHTLSYCIECKPNILPSVSVAIVIKPYSPIENLDR